MAEKTVRPIFVLGSPRSGTTMIGNFIGSSPEVCNLGEYGGFYLTRYLIEESLIKKMPSPYRQSYMAELRKHASRFAFKQARIQDTDYLLDATPGNLLIAKALSIEFPDAIFVLMLRHYSGVILSLQRSYKEGYLWAGRTWKDRASLWRYFYSRVIDIPEHRSIIVGYDQLCLNPNKVLSKLLKEFQKHGLPTRTFDMRQLARSHATNIGDSRATIGSISPHGKISFQCIKSYNEKHWNKDIHECVRPVVSGIDALLSELFPSKYLSPL